jgi:hypothetical protein
MRQLTAKTAFLYAAESDAWVGCAIAIDEHTTGFQFACQLLGQLDFRTFRYVPNADDEASEIWIRANYTIEVLGLNKRDALVRGCKTAFSGFASRLRSWVEKRADWTLQDQQAFIEDFRAERYRGVWECMKRYRHSMPALREIELLVEVAPETLQW